MRDQSDDIDEVALNALLAEGIDLPTAIEASRLNGESTSGHGSCLGIAAIAIVVGGLVYALF